jgi:hypothetical protein
MLKVEARLKKDQQKSTFSSEFHVARRTAVMSSLLIQFGWRKEGRK